MLNDVKLMLGIDNDKSDAILNLMLNDATDSVLNYCHIKELPTALHGVVRSVVVANFNAHNDGIVASIKRGDTTISYNNPISIFDFTEKQKSSLNSFRKWRVR